MISFASFLQTFGGLGIFLIGMIVMTDGLRQLAGDSVKFWLARFTRSPLSGVATGTACTALLQSSSATTVAAVGFVGAGLISFPAALGVVFGANLGTTITGWIVTVVGFKLNLIGLMYPCILLGAVLRLFAQQRMGTIGLALAGFGLIFVGIDILQSGMQGMRSFISEFQWDAGNYLDRIKLVGVGVIFTIVTQSSSAGVAAVLTALFAEAITLGQGLALVIGMDIGTTVTAAMAAVGGATGSQRTGLSHVIYNILTGCMAFLLISPYIYFIESVAPQRMAGEPELALVAFHSGFNFLGVLLILPFTSNFASFIERIVPGDEDIYTAQLDKRLREDPAIALGAVRAAVVSQLIALFEQVEVAVESRASRTVLDRISRAIDRTLEFAADIPSSSSSDCARELTALLHVLDHMSRLVERCRHVVPTLGASADEVELQQMSERLKEFARLHVELLRQSHRYGSVDQAEEVLERFEQFEQPFRSHVIGRVADGEISIYEADNLLDRARWLHRVNRHVGKIILHLEKAV